MRVIRVLVYILFILSIGFSGYLWFVRIPTLEKVIKDLNEENLNLLRSLSESRSTSSDSVLTIVIPSDEVFEPGSIEISKGGKEKMDSLVKELLQSGFNGIEVGVYTDKSPVQTNKDKYPTNWELAGARAAAIVRYMISRGIDSKKLKAVSYGDSRAEGVGSSYRQVEIKVF
ncbi:MAG: OmpA family protein [candidate division WOR-3 bacterium]